MKNTILQLSLTILFFATFLSCSSSDSDTNQTSPTTVNTWKMNDYNFSRRVSTQVLTTYSSGQPFTQVNVDSNISSTNNNFKACNVVFWFNTQSQGVYSAKSANTLASNVTSNFMNIKCTVTDTAGKGAIYESVDSNTTLNVETIDGKFAITGLNDITLTKTLDDGLSNAPTTMTFKCNKVL